VRWPCRLGGSGFGVFDAASGEEALRLLHAAITVDALQPSQSRLLSLGAGPSTDVLLS
jgi:hypothetical protein